MTSPTVELIGQIESATSLPLHGPKSKPGLPWIVEQAKLYGGVHGDGETGPPTVPDGNYLLYLDEMEIVHITGGDDKPGGADNVKTTN